MQVFFLVTDYWTQDDPCAVPKPLNPHDTFWASIAGYEEYAARASLAFASLETIPTMEMSG